MRRLPQPQGSPPPAAAPPPALAAVVVTHRSAETIDACLSRLRAARGVAEIRVIDNASDDDTVAIVQRHALADARVRFIANPDNPGFGIACNQGAEDSAAPWLAFVNPDCLVEADTFARMLAHAAIAPVEAQAEAQADAQGGRQGEPPAVLLGADLVDEAGVRDGAARRRDPDFAAMLRSPSARKLDLSVDAQRPLQPVDAVSGALMLLPRRLFDALHGFDPGYRLHAEDLDFCRRARAAGALVAVANDVRVVHVRGVSGRSRPWFVEWHKHRGLARYFLKFEAAERGIATRAAVLAMIWGRFPVAAAAAAWRVRRG